MPVRVPVPVSRDKASVRPLRSSVSSPSPPSISVVTLVPSTSTRRSSPAPRLTLSRTLVAFSVSLPLPRRKLSKFTAAANQPSPPKVPRLVSMVSDAVAAVTSIVSVSSPPSRPLVAEPPLRDTTSLPPPIVTAPKSTDAVMLSSPLPKEMASKPEMALTASVPENWPASRSSIVLSISALRSRVSWPPPPLIRSVIRPPVRKTWSLPSPASMAVPLPPVMVPELTMVSLREPRIRRP